MTRRIGSLVLLTLAVIVCIALTGCGDDDSPVDGTDAPVAGTYELDLQAYKAAAKAEIEKRATTQDVESGMLDNAIQMMADVIDGMSMILTLNKDGTATMDQTMATGTQKMIGTWTLDDTTISITAAAEGFPEQTISGTVDGDTITLHPADDQAMPFDMTFNRKEP